MGTYTINRAEFKKSFTGKNGGEFAVYEVELNDGEGFTTAEMVQKSATPAPEVGSSVEGTIEAGTYGMKFRKAFAGGGGGNGRGGFGKSPDEQARIARMNSHAHALTYWRLKHEGDPTFTLGSWKAYTDIVDLFFNDVQNTKAAS